MEKYFTKIANNVAYATGKPITFILCCTVIVVWAVSGPLFGFSDTWQLIINTGTTIVTFLMVFLIQNTQNRDGAALQTKLDELIRASKHARNLMMNLQNCTDEELEELQREFARLRKRAIGTAEESAQSGEEGESVCEQAAERLRDSNRSLATTTRPGLRRP